MITKQELRDAIQAYLSDVAEGTAGMASMTDAISHDRIAALLTRLPDVADVRPFRPVQHYAPGGAAMSDAIERLDDELNAIKLVLDTHRAALVAAGLISINGEPVVRGE